VGADLCAVMLPESWLNAMKALVFAPWGRNHADVALDFANASAG
jgi:hypothetical protein